MIENSVERNNVLNNLSSNKSFQKANGSAIVVGASLSGLMTGLALARAGMYVTILERANENRRSGAGLQVDSGERDKSATAKYLRKLASGGIQSGEAWTSIEYRLRVAVKANPNIDLRFETRVKTVEQDETSAWVVTDKGETFSGDILIGADGYRSIVRRHVAPHKPDATFAGYIIWIGIVEEKYIPKQYRLGPYTPLAMPNGIGDFLLGATIAGEDGSWTVGDRRLGWAWYDNTQNDLLRQIGCVKGNVVQHSLHPELIPEEALNELAQKAKERWGQPWLTAIQHSIQTRTVTGIPISEYVPDTLVNGRIALVDDAAHVPTPLTASGFNASLQDAATIAECIEKGIQGKAAEKALLQYQSLRLKEARQIVQAGQNFSHSFGRQ